MSSISRIVMMGICLSLNTDKAATKSAKVSVTTCRFPSLILCIGIRLGQASSPARDVVIRKPLACRTLEPCLQRLPLAAHQSSALLGVGNAPSICSKRTIDRMPQPVRASKSAICDSSHAIYDECHQGQHALT